LLDAQAPDLLRVTYPQPGQLRAHDLIGLPLGHADEIDAFLGSRKTSPIAAGTDLLELHHVALLVGCHPPGTPEHSPLALGVRRERSGASEAVTPGGEERILLMGHQDHLGIALEGGRHAATAPTRVPPVD